MFPFRPLIPRSPLCPAGPMMACLPFFPGDPIIPLSPFFLGAPLLPLRPWSPFSPHGPDGPGGPGGPVLQKASFDWQSFSLPSADVSSLLILLNVSAVAFAVLLLLTKFA